MVTVVEQEKFQFLRYLRVKISNEILEGIVIGTAILLLQSRIIFSEEITRSYISCDGEDERSRKFQCSSLFISVFGFLYDVYLALSSSHDGVIDWSF